VNYEDLVVSAMSLTCPKIFSEVYCLQGESLEDRAVQFIKFFLS
jgi:hypothetical protein